MAWRVNNLITPVPHNFPLSPRSSSTKPGSVLVYLLAFLNSCNFDYVSLPQKKNHSIFCVEVVTTGHSNYREKVMYVFDLAAAVSGTPFSQVFSTPHGSGVYSSIRSETTTSTALGVNKNGNDSGIAGKYCQQKYWVFTLPH